MRRETGCLEDETCRWHRRRRGALPLRSTTRGAATTLSEKLQRVVGTPIALTSSRDAGDHLVGNGSSR